MQIVIEIPDEDVPNKQEIIDINLHFIAGEVCECTYPYIVLPKGHGRLIDADKIEWYGCDFEGRGCVEAKGDCSVCNHANCYAKQVRELPTIIEAESDG